MPSQPSSQPSAQHSDSDHTVLDAADQQPKLDSLVSGRNSIQAITTEPAESASQGEEPKDQGQKKAKAEGEGRGRGRNQRRKNNKNKNNGNGNHGNGNHGNGNKAAAKQPHDVDGNTDPNAVGHVGTSLNLTLSKALMTKLKRQAKTEGVSMEALATELISEGCVLRAWEIVERKGHLRDASSNQSGNSYGNGGGGQRRGNGNNRNDNGRQQKNGNSRNMNKQRYNAIMDDKANFLEYVRNQEKYNR